MFSLFVFNSIDRHKNNRQYGYFFSSGKFLGQNPPTVEELKEKLEPGNDRYIQILCYYSRNIKGSNNYWRSKTHKLEGWIQHHDLRRQGPPTFFITFSCAESWWPDLRQNLAQLECRAGNELAAQLLESNNFKATQRAPKKYPLFVKNFFMERSQSFMGTILKDKLGIEHYWGRAEFAQGRGQIHLHILGIAKDMAYLLERYLQGTNNGRQGSGCR